MKIFVISRQRTGTTSTGIFFRKMGFKVANWDISNRNLWTQKCFEGNYESILNSDDFIYNEVFEDDPWWCFDFYKFLYHKVPNSYFILFERDPDKWFDSLKSHTKGKTLGNTYIHCALYNRLSEYHSLSLNNINIHDNLLYIKESHRDHYKKIYEAYNKEVKNFFQRNKSSNFINLSLTDPKKWDKLKDFFNINNNFSDDVWVKP